MIDYSSFSSLYLLTSAQHAGKKIAQLKSDKKTGSGAFKKYWNNYRDVVNELYKRKFSHTDHRWYLSGVMVQYDPRRSFLSPTHATVVSSNSAWVIIKPHDHPFPLKVDDLTKLKISYIS